MSCAEARERLGAYLEGDLAGPHRERLEAHLERCGGCRAEREALRRTAALVRSLPDPAPPPHLAGRIVARLRDGEGRPRWWQRPTLRAPAAAVLALAAAVGALQLASGPTDRIPEALTDPEQRPRLELRPPVGAPQAPEPGTPPDEATLDAWLGHLRADPGAFLGAWAQVDPEAREHLAPPLAARARSRGEAAELARVLRATGDPAGEALAAHLEP